MMPWSGKPSSHLVVMAAQAATRCSCSVHVLLLHVAEEAASLYEYVDLLLLCLTDMVTAASDRWFLET